MDEIKAFEGDWAGQAFNRGKTWGDGVANNIKNTVKKFSPENLLNGFKQNSAESTMQKYPSMTGSFGNIGNGGAVPVDIKKNRDKDKKVKLSDEDFKLLRDIAVKDYNLYYKQITPNVNIKFGDVRETADVQDVKRELERMMREELAETYVVREG